MLSSMLFSGMVLLEQVQHGGSAFGARRAPNCKLLVTVGEKRILSASANSQKDTFSKLAIAKDGTP